MQQPVQHHFNQPINPMNQMSPMNHLSNMNQKAYNLDQHRMSGTQNFNQFPQNNSIPQQFIKQQASQIPHVNSNSLPPSARFVDANERFSYSKFGNITLPAQVQQQPKQQKPMYSYDIPEINQILNNTKGNRPINVINANIPKPK